MSYNPNIHHRRSIRLKGYDYSQAGLYFITICTKDRECFFGKIVGVENFQPVIILNDGGKFTNECWMEIPKHFPNVVLHEHIVMPNHVHGIVELSDATNVGAENFLPLHGRVQNFEPQQNSFQRMIPRSVGSIVKGFKIGVTKWFHANTDIETLWQRNYHEHIIRNEKSYQTISEYIINNPAKWNDDKFFIQ
jgi:REP element-mobilizing transposase RayT